MEKENQVSRVVVECAIEVHRTLGGPGLVESVYEQALMWELRNKDLDVSNQIVLPIRYKNQPIGSLRIDLLVNNLVIVECKATTQDDKIFESQLLTYLRLSGLKLGLLINFGQQFVRDGIHRIINGF